MLMHQNREPAAPARAVVLGSRGFVGRYTVEHLQSLGIATLPVSSSDLDLTRPQSVDSLKSFLRSDDALVFISALTPDRGRDIGTLMRNLSMAEHVAAAVASQPCAHVVYISSDAVYADEANPVNERSSRSPSSYHGLMHFARERMLVETGRTANIPLAILRPSVLYGPGDTHNGYGPNRFLRTALAEAKVAIFGDGEEKRDHVFIEDVAVIVGLVLRHRSEGTLNIATGVSISFGDIAQQIARLSGGGVQIERLPRAPGSAVTHRHFDITAALQAWPQFHYTVLAAGLAASWRAVAASTTPAGV